MGLFDEKTEGQKSRDTVPLKLYIVSRNFALFRGCFRGKFLALMSPN
jgi:hypothetical protein